MPTTSPLFGILLCLATFQAGRYIQKKTRISIMNPLLIAIILCILILKLFSIPYENFATGGSIIQMMLAPATAVLALNVYQNRRTLKKFLFPVIIGCLAGSITSIVSVTFLCNLFKLDEGIASALWPKSCTTPIAVSIVEIKGGIVPIAVLAVIFTGMLGAIFAPLWCKWFRIKNDVAQGIAIGASSHALGTTKAVEMGEMQGAMSSIALILCGIATLVLAIFF